MCTPSEQNFPAGAVLSPGKCESAKIKHLLQDRIALTWATANICIHSPCFAHSVPSQMRKHFKFAPRLHRFTRASNCFSTAREFAGGLDGKGPYLPATVAHAAAAPGQGMEASAQPPSLAPVLAAVVFASFGALAFGYHLGVVNGPLEAIAADLGFAGNAALQGTVCSPITAVLVPAMRFSSIKRSPALPPVEGGDVDLAGSAAPQGPGVFSHCQLPPCCGYGCVPSQCLATDTTVACHAL